MDKARSTGLCRIAINFASGLKAKILLATYGRYKLRWRDSPTATSLRHVEKYAVEIEGSAQAVFGLEMGDYSGRDIPISGCCSRFMYKAVVPLLWPHQEGKMKATGTYQAHYRRSGGERRLEAGQIGD